MAKRRANGEGSIRKRKNGRLEGRYTAGWDPKTGKSVYKNALSWTRAEIRENSKRSLWQTKNWTS